MWGLFANLSCRVWCSKIRSAHTPAPPMNAKLSCDRAPQYGTDGGGLNGINFANPLTENHVNIACGGEGAVLLLKRSLVSWHACVNSGLPEQPSERFAKFIPSPVWKSWIGCISWVKVWVCQRHGARSGAQISWRGPRCQRACLFETRHSAWVSLGTLGTP